MQAASTVAAAALTAQSSAAGTAGSVAAATTRMLRQTGDRAGRLPPAAAALSSRAADRDSSCVNDSTEWMPRCRLCFQPRNMCDLRPHPDAAIAALLDAAVAAAAAGNGCVGPLDRSGVLVCGPCAQVWSAWDEPKWEDARQCDWCGDGDSDGEYACDECGRRVCLTCLAANYGGAAAELARVWHACGDAATAELLPWQCPSCEPTRAHPLRAHVPLADVAAVGSLVARRTINPFALADGVRGMTYLTPRGHPRTAQVRRRDPINAQWNTWQGEGQAAAAAAGSPSAAAAIHSSPSVSVRFPEQHRAGFYEIGSATTGAQGPPIEPLPAIEWEPSQEQEQGHGQGQAPWNGRASAASSSFAAAAAASPASSSPHSPPRLLRLVSTSLFRYAPGIGVHDWPQERNPFLKYWLGLLTQVEEFPRVFPYDQGWRLRVYWDDSLTVPCGCEACYPERHRSQQHQPQQPQQGSKRKTGGSESESVRFDLCGAWSLLRSYLSTLPFVQLVYFNWPHLQSRERWVYNRAIDAPPASAAPGGAKVWPDGAEVWTHAGHHVGYTGMLARFLALAELGHTAELVLLSDLDGRWSRHMKEHLDLMMQRKTHCLRAVDSEYKVELWGGASAFAFHRDSPTPLRFDWLESSLHAFACWHLRHPDTLRQLRGVRQHFPKQAAEETRQATLAVLRKELADGAQQGQSKYDSEWTDERVCEEYGRLFRGDLSHAPLASGAAAPKVSPAMQLQRQRQKKQSQGGGGSCRLPKQSQGSGGKTDDESFCSTSEDEYKGLFPYAADQTFLTYFVWAVVRDTAWSIQAARAKEALAVARSHNGARSSVASGARFPSTPSATCSTGGGSTLAGVENLFVSLPAKSKEGMEKITAPLEGVGVVPKNLPAFTKYLQPLHSRAVLTGGGGQRNAGTDADAEAGVGAGGKRAKSKSRRSAPNTIELCEENIVAYTREWIAQHSSRLQQNSSNAKAMSAGTNNRKSAPLAAAVAVKKEPARNSSRASSTLSQAKPTRARHSMPATGAATYARNNGAGTGVHVERDYCDLSSDSDEEEEEDSDDSDEDAALSPDSSVEDAGDDGEFRLSSRRGRPALIRGSVGSISSDRPVRKKARVAADQSGNDDDDGGRMVEQQRRAAHAAAVPIRRVAAGGGRIVAACSPPPAWLSVSRPADRAGPTEHKAAINPNSRRGRCDSPTHAHRSLCPWDEDEDEAEERKELAACDDGADEDERRDEDMGGAASPTFSPSPIPSPCPSASPPTVSPVSSPQPLAPQPLQPLPPPLSASSRLVLCPSSASSGTSGSGPSSVRSNTTTQASAKCLKGSPLFSPSPWSPSASPSPLSKGAMSSPLLPLALPLPLRPAPLAPPLLPVITDAAMHDALLSQTITMVKQVSEKEERKIDPPLDWCVASLSPSLSPSSSLALGQLGKNGAVLPHPMECDPAAEEDRASLIDLTQPSPPAPSDLAATGLSAQASSADVRVVPAGPGEAASVLESVVAATVESLSTTHFEGQRCAALVRAPPPVPAIAAAFSSTPASTAAASADALTPAPALHPLAPAAAAAAGVLHPSRPASMGPWRIKAEADSSPARAPAPAPAPSSDPLRSAPPGVDAASDSRPEVISIDDDDDDDAEDRAGAGVGAGAIGSVASDPVSVRDRRYASLRLSSRDPASLLVHDLLHHPDMRGADRWLRINLPQFPADDHATPRCLLWHATPKQLERIFRDINQLAPKTFATRDIAAQAKRLHQLLHAPPT